MRLANLRKDNLFHGNDEMKSIYTNALMIVCAGLAGSAWAQAQDADAGIIPHKIVHPIMHPDSALPAAPPTGGTGSVTPAITWHGGPVMGGSPDIHLIWYGNWAQTNGSDNAAGQAIVRDFMTNVSGSNYLAINKGYTGSGGTQVSGLLNAPHEATVGYLSGARAKRLRDSDIATIVGNYINSHGGPQTNAVYFVLTSSDVNETSGFCTAYCGWHTNGTIAGANIRYSFVGNANRCLSGCAIQSTSPNNNPGVDGMVSVVAHELEEALSDPDPRSGWADSAGAENADKCAWTFGHAQQTAANGSFYNITLPTATGTRNFLVQRNLDKNSVCYIDGVTLQQ